MNRSQLLKLAIGALVIFVVFRVMCRRRKYGSPKTTAAPYDVYEDYENWSPETWATIPPNTITNRPVVTTSPTARQLLTATPRPLATSVALLPQTSPSPQPGQTSWSEFAPQSLQGQQLLDPVKYVGVDTQGSTLKNASHDLRRDPAIPRVDVGPFLNSTYDADPWRKNLDDCQ